MKKVFRYVPRILIYSVKRDYDNENGFFIIDADGDLGIGFQLRVTNGRIIGISIYFKN